MTKSGSAVVSEFSRAAPIHPSTGPSIRLKNNATRRSTERPLVPTALSSVMAATIALANESANIDTDKSTTDLRPEERSTIFLFALAHGRKPGFIGRVPSVQVVRQPVGHNMIQRPFICPIVVRVVGVFVRQQVTVNVVRTFVSCRRTPFCPSYTTKFPFTVLLRWARVRRMLRTNVVFISTTMPFWHTRREVSPCG